MTDFADSSGAVVAPDTIGHTRQSAAKNNISPNDTRIHLSPTERRIINLLLDRPQLSYDVEKLAFCRYAADNVQHIRAKGIGIITTMVDYERQVDGKVVKVGEYSISPDSRAVAVRSAGTKVGKNATG